MPGAGKQPPEVQEHIKELLEAGFDPTTIHRRLKVGRSSIYRMKRCLQQHGTAYMPVELNKKNGRPKVLSAEQELEVRDWLRTPSNRTRYLDDLVWLIHDRFGIVCSTTTMSKMKRKWLRVIDYEENGRPLDETTRQSLLETHPDLDILQQPGAMPVQDDDDDEGLQVQQALPGAQMNEHMSARMDDGMGHGMASSMGMGASAAPTAMMMPATHPAFLPHVQHQHQQRVEVDVPIEPELDSHSQLSLVEAQLQREIAGQNVR